MAKDGDPKTILSKFLDWVREHGGRHMLYRGIAGTAKERPASAAIARRLPSMGEKDDAFISANQELIETARMRGHDTRKNLQDNLDILAELQHYGAATCLMDFTRNPLVGLWFACWNPPSIEGRVSAKDKVSAKGRVLAIDSGDYDRFVKINTDGMEKSIEYLLTSSQRKGKLWVWEPKSQNERIIAQQSVFVFGDAEIQEPEHAQPQQPKRVQPQQSKYVRPEHVFFVENTKGVLDELQKYGMSLKSLFCDFDGFARANESAQQFGEENYLDKATEEHARELHELAIKYYNRALGASKNKSIHYHLGRAKASLGAAARKTKADASKADAYYKQAIKDYNESPNSKEMLFHRGVARDQLGDHKDAIVDYDRAIKLDSEYTVAYNSRGIAKDKLGHYKDAIIDYDRAIELNRQYAGAYNNRGIAKDKLGRYKGAIADYNRAIKWAPQSALAYNNRGMTKKRLCDKKGTKADYDYTSAIADYDRAIELDPQYAGGYYNRGNAKYALGNYKSAIADYDQAIELNPQYAAAYNNRGIAKRIWRNKEGAKAAYKYTSAIADYDRAIELNPQYAKAYYNRGIAKRAQGDEKGATKDFQEAEKLAPSLKPPKKE